MIRSLLLLAVLLLSGCATVDKYFGAADGTIEGQEFPRGEVVPAPMGYYLLCAREPESIFCK